jgi:hypothetical protein
MSHLIIRIIIIKKLRVPKEEQNIGRENKHRYITMNERIHHIDDD